MIVPTAAAVITLFYTMQYARYYLALLPPIDVIGVGTVFEVVNWNSRMTP